MQIIQWETLSDAGSYSDSPAYARAEADLEAAIEAVVWPEGAREFTIYPQSGKKTGEGNGVVPIKKGFMATLRERGWVEEYGRTRGGSEEIRPGAFDAHLTFPSELDSLPFVVEWETGNISSTHRAINRIALGVLEERIAGGVVVLPSTALAKFLTDRIGNSREVQPYIPLWREWRELSSPSYLGLVTVEHDAESFDVPRIPKGTDGRAAR